MADYIDREKLIKALERKKSGSCNVNYRNGFADAILTIKTMTENAPVEDIAPVKHSEWVIYEDDDFDYEEPIKVTEETLWQEEHKHPCHTNPQCKECHYHALLNGGEEYVLSDYCPKCGAKMDGGEK